jgi:aspartate/methionine/tyrosine aminotransferase
MGSLYMEWAKTRQASRFNLATSGLPNLPLQELGAGLGDLQLSTGGLYGYPPLVDAIASRYRVPRECVVAGTGASGANHLALATLLEPGDEVVAEHPTYELIVSLARHLGARVSRFPRKLEEGWAVDPSAIERALTPRTRLVVLTNLHNPTSTLLPEATLREVGRIAERVGARVLVDEVYLDCLYTPHPPTCALLGPTFISTSSLTKAFGFSGLRCGWILAEPELARRMWRLNDLFGVNAVHVAEQLSVRAFQGLEALGARQKALLDANRQLLRAYLAEQPSLKAAVADHGTVVFPRFLGGSVDALEALLREKYETTIVPGHFFEMPEHFRIGLSIGTEVFREGLARLGKAIEELKRT